MVRFFDGHFVWNLELIKDILELFKRLLGLAVRNEDPFA